MLLRLDATRSSSASGDVEGGSGLTSEADRVYWIGQQLIWNPYPSGASWLGLGLFMMQWMFLVGEILEVVRGETQ